MTAVLILASFINKTGSRYSIYTHQEKLCYEYNQRSINKICSFYKSIFALKQIKASTYAFLAQKYCTMQWPSGCMLAR